MDRVEIAIVGAGAAGLAAARRLRAAGREVLVLEARDRLGGRAHTALTEAGPVDLGGGWLHSGDRNPWTGLAEKLGFAIDKTPPFWEQPGVGDVLTPADERAFQAAMAAFDERLAAAAADGREGAAADHLEPGGRWNVLLNAVSTWYNGAELDQVSVLDYAAYGDDEVNWRTPDGYGALVAAYGEGVPVRLNTIVTAIDRSGPVLRLATSGGELLADQAVLAVPTPVLAEERLQITPSAPEVLDACAVLPLGLADKVYLAVDSGGFEPDTGLFGRSDTLQTGSYHLRPFGRPLVEVFLGGRWAHELESQGAGAAAEFAIGELTAVFGSSLRRKLRPLAETAWAADPFARGSYSHALPGQAGARAVLRRPIEDRIWFAGEACSAQWFSTVHGAYRSGIEAAEALLGLGPDE